MKLAAKDGALSWALAVALGASGCGGSAEDANGDGDGASGGDVGTGASDAAGGDAASGGDAATGGSATGGASTGGSGETSTGGLTSGGTSAGGSGGDGGTGGDDSSSGGQGVGGSDGCSVQAAGPFAAGAARSAGFSGTDAQYSELYDQLCEVDADCVDPCMERGGTMTFCEATVCVEGSTTFCLPPTKWRTVDGALSPSDSTSQAAVTSLSLANGDEHDLLLVDDFGFDLPDDAEIVGIVAAVRKAKGSNDLVTDYALQLVSDGVLVGDDRGTSQEWPTELSEVEYGTSSDSWGTTWTSEEVNDPGFGVAIGALPGQGSGRAYVDAVHLSVYFEQPCP